MRISSLQAGILRYLLTVAAITAALIAVKLVITWLVEIYIHPIPILGGWLKSLEIVELDNIVIFAMLGFGIGGASRFLPAKVPVWQKTIALVLIMPLVFFSSYWLRQTLWLNGLTASSDLTHQQVTELANRALKQESGTAGFWGYYKTTTRTPILPTSTEELQRMAEDQQWFRSEMTRFSGIEPGVFSLVFDGAGWGIRIFHMVLALLTGLIYHFKGLAWADAARLRQMAKAKS